MKTKHQIPFAKVPLTGNELKYIKEVLESGWLTTAKKAALFEQQFSEYVHAPYACAVNSGTAALHLALEAVGVKAGDKVFVPTMTFTASAEVIRYLSADPVLLDVDYGTRLLTPEILKKAIKKHPDVRFLVLVHFGGQAAQMFSKEDEGILELCQKNNIKIVEDAAHAFPGKSQGKMVGSLGSVTCFSFYANKTITTGEGGMLVTQDEEVYERAKTMRLHGINKDVWDRFNNIKSSWEYDVVAPGYKYNMSDVLAAIGLAQLEQAENFRVKRQKVAEYYYEQLKHLSDVLDLPETNIPFEEHAWHLFPVVIRKGGSINRNKFIQRLSEKGIGTSVHYKPLHRMTYYKERYGLKNKAFPNSEKIWQGSVSLPIYPDLKEEELYYICQEVTAALK